MISSRGRGESGIVGLPTGKSPRRAVNAARGAVDLAGRPTTPIEDARPARSVGGETPPLREPEAEVGIDARSAAPPPHSITSSAWASSVGGMSMPSALAVLRLIDELELVRPARPAGRPALRL